MKYFKKSLYKYSEIISYGFWGIMTTILNYIVYFSFTKILHTNYIFANTSAWVLAVAFAFITNKLFVFHSKTWSGSVALRELWQFISARLFSLVVETIILYIFVDSFGFRDDIMKLFTNIIVIIINYVLSKLIIFKR